MQVGIEIYMWIAMLLAMSAAILHRGPDRHEN